MSVDIVKNNHIRLADDLNLSTNTVQQSNDLSEATVKVGALAPEKITVVEVKEAEEANSQLSIAQNRLDEEAEKEQTEESNNVADAMKTISEFINMPIRTVNFTQDDGSERTVIKIFDSESNELIKQFPSEELLSIAQRIVELRQDVSKKTGILLDESI